MRNIDLIHNIYEKTLPKHNTFYLTLSMVGIKPRYTYVDTNKSIKNHCVLNSIIEIDMYFVKWIAYQDPNPHGMQQIGLSTK